MARGLYPAVEAIHQTQNKITRILSTEPLTEAKHIRFARHLLKTCPEYFRQWDDFPTGDHDDGPDATEGVVRILEKGAIANMAGFSAGTRESVWRVG